MNSDHPVESRSDDALGRAYLAHHVADRLIFAPMEHSIVFGLYGPWGSGKTSLLNMVCEELENHDSPPVVVKFNPWNYPSSKNLVTPFLALLSECIRRGEHSSIPLKASWKLSNTIKNYSEVLASTADAFNWVPGLGIVSAVLRHFGKEDKKSASPAILKSRLSKLLLDTNTRIVVIIDDLDRLSNEAVRSVFQLVAAVADFPGVNYLLAYDLNNVIKALESVQGCEGERYLEKIVQIPIELHEPNSESILKMFVDGIDELVPNFRLSYDEQNDMGLSLQLVFTRVKTMRDMRRLLNVFEVDLLESFGSVAPGDLLVMSALRLFAPRLFPWISAHRSELAGEVGGGYKPALVTDTLEADKGNKLRYEILVTLDSNSEAASYAVDLLCKAFPRFADACGIRTAIVSEVSLRLNNRIACPEILDRYLSGLLGLYSFPRDEAMRLVKGGTADELEAFFAQERGEVSSTIMSAAVELAPSLPVVQLDSITRALLRSGAGKSKYSAPSGLFSTFRSSLEGFLRLLGTEAASRILVEETQDRSFPELVPLAEFINAQELAYARLAGEKENPDEQLITLECLLEVERNIVRSLRDAVILPLYLEDSGAHMLLYLWSCFDADSYERQVTNGLLRDPLGYTLYAVHCLGTYVSSEAFGWVLPKNLPNDIDLPMLCSCMDVVAESEDFLKLYSGMQSLVAALSVCAEKAVNGAIGVDWDKATASEGEVERRLRLWKARLIS